MSTTKLVIDYEYDFDLYGIVAPIKEYKLAWLLNKEFGWNLCKRKDLELDFLNDGKLGYNLEIGGGLGEFSGKAWRIGLMGYGARRENVSLCLKALEESLR